MNLAELEQKLIAAARAHPPADSVPYAFSRRIMARLPARAPQRDELAWWTQALWRAAVSCVALVALLSVWSWSQPPAAASGSDLSQDFENTVLAVVDQEQPPDNTW